MPPTTIGLRRISRAYQNSLFELLNKKISAFINGYTSPQCPEFSGDIANRVDRLISPDGSPVILLAVSGSGKTKHLEAFLSKYWGIYLAAGNLSPGSSALCRTNQDYLLTARRKGHSKDLYWLYRLIQQSSTTFGPGFDMKYCEDLAKVLLFSRIGMLGIFLETAEDLQCCPTPHMWLEFQKQQEQDDQSSALFWASLLHFNSLSQRKTDYYGAEYYFNTTEKIRARLKNGRLFFVYDEAQCDIAANLEIRPYALQQRNTFLDLILGAIGEVRVEITGGKSENAGVILSGTSLYLQQFQLVVDEVEKVTRFWSGKA